MYRILALTAMLAFAGCIAPPESVDTASTDASSPAYDPESAAVIPPSEGRMTADESEMTSEDFCLDGGISFPDLRVQCATRVITVEGDLELAALPVLLTTDSGDIRVTVGGEGTWSLVTTIRAAGATADQARANLDDVTFTWSIEDTLGYKLSARTERTNNGGNGPSVEMVATLPPSVLYGITMAASSGDLNLEKLGVKGAHLSASSGDISISSVTGELLTVEASSGDITVTDAKVDRILAQSSSGDLVISGETATATLASTSGDITAKFTPTKTGAYAISATSGNIELSLPENSKQGYDLSAQVTSGDITIGLKDGKTSGSDEQKRFQTTGFAQRTIRTGVALASTSGDIQVGAGSSTTPLTG